MSSLYGRQSLVEAVTEDGDINLTEAQMDDLVQLMAYDEVMRMSDVEKQSLMESGTVDVLQERQVLNKKTMMRLSKEDDTKRRIKLIAYKLAKDDGNPGWKKMVLRRQQWREERDKILARYGKKAKKLATIATKEYINRAKKEPVKK